VGTEAYAAYVNSLGGVNGRKLIVDAENDQFEGARTSPRPSRRSKTTSPRSEFLPSRQFRGDRLAANPGFANVSVALSQSANDLPNTFSVSPVRYGWQLGGLPTSRSCYPSDITKTGAILSSLAVRPEDLVAESRPWIRSATRSSSSRRTTCSRRTSPRPS